MKKNLLLVTDDFPYGKGESFLIPEIQYIQQTYRLTVVTSNTQSNLEGSKFASIPTYRVGFDITPADALKYFFSFLFNSIAWKEMYMIVREKSHVLGKLKGSFGYYARGRKFFNQLDKAGLLHNQDIIYSYWHNHKLVGLAIGLRKYKSRPVIVTRIHGYDLFNERWSSTFRQPFKPLIDSYIDMVAFVSEAGYWYYRKNFGFKGNCRYVVARLGVENSFGTIEKNSDSKLHLLSCSNVIPLKRVELIIEALSLIDSFAIEWTHIGGGSSFEHIEKLSMEKLGRKGNISYHLTGALLNEQVHALYQSNKIDAFITTSSTEGGCPVSIQEAFSYGLPAIGTCVGGIPEMIKDGQNGYLLTENPTIEEIVDVLAKMYDRKMTNQIHMMKACARKTWEDDFNAKKNSSSFIETIGSFALSSAGKSQSVHV